MAWHCYLLASTNHGFLVYFKFIHRWVLHKREFGCTAPYLILYLLCSGEYSFTFSEDIHGCIYISVMLRSTYRTSPRPITQLQILFLVSAYRARLGTRIESVNEYNFLVVIVRLINENLLETIETDLVDCPCKMMILYHSADIQIFHENYIIVFEQFVHHQALCSVSVPAPCSDII